MNTRYKKHLEAFKNTVVSVVNMTVEIHNHCQLLVVHQITALFKICKNETIHKYSVCALSSTQKFFIRRGFTFQIYAVKTILLSDVVIY